MLKKYLFLLILIACLMVAMSCNKGVPPEALKLNKKSLEQRQLQTRIYDTDNEEKVLNACVGVIQDLGFNIKDTSSKLGVLVGTKKRDATKASQVVAAAFAAALTGQATPVDDEQKMKISIVTNYMSKGKERIKVRVTFQRLVWNTRGNITKREFLDNPEIYQEFYSKLSKSLFLEAHKI